MKKPYNGLALAAIALIAAACGTTSGADAADAGATEATSPPVKQLVTAAAGGTVATSDGKVKLLLPPGVLAKDTEITVQQQPAQAGTAGPVYQFGPDGLQFTKPATLTLQFDAKAAPDGKTASVATWLNGAWQPVAGSAVVGTAVSAPIAHFSGYTIIWVGNGAPAVSAACKTVVSGFAACGGDVVGTWSYKEACGAIGQPAKSFPECPAAKLSTTIDFNMTMTFAADGTATYDSKGITFVTELSYPMTCAKMMPHGADGIDCPATLPAGNGGPGLDTCTQSAGVCTCTGKQMDPAKTSKGTYAAKGNQLTLDGKPGNDYCVTGATLVIMASQQGADGAPPTKSYTILQRQK